MIIISEMTQISIAEETAVTLGKFDGIHRGHQRLMHAILAQKSAGYKTVVFTFAAPPAALITKEIPQNLTTKEEKRELLAGMGIDYLIEYPFNETVRSMEPEVFVKRIIGEQLHARYIAVGDDYGFGYQRSGNAETLKRFAKELKYSVNIIPKECYHGREISSTLVKEELERGKIEAVNALLGRRYSFCGEVVRGRELARTWGFPTLNLIPEAGKALPPFGVYCVTAIINGKSYEGICNLGVKPTVTSDKQILLETHLFSFQEDIYGKSIKVSLHHFVRKEKIFSGVDKLRQQLNQDMLLVKTYFEEKSHAEEKTKKETIR